jgi:hypothetical protein
MPVPPVTTITLSVRLNIYISLFNLFKRRFGFPQAKITSGNIKETQVIISQVSFALIITRTGIK